jgi:type III pantothenate kinase
MSTRLLLLDAGNTRLKWAVLDTALKLSKPHQSGATEPGLSASPPWLGQGAASYDDLTALFALWQKWGVLAACYGVNVAGDATGALLSSALAKLELKPVWLNANLHACGVHNLYRPPESLGADRWAALLAVRRRTHEAALIVSAGSALTVDAMDADGQFLGGIIVPGLHMMRQALARSTAQVGIQHGEVLAFPNTTADAVETGLIAACTGAIETQRSRLEKITEILPRLFLTGGDAAMLEAFLPSDLEIIPGLVLEGVYYLSVEEGLT